MAALTPALKVYAKQYVPGQETVTFTTVTGNDTYIAQTLSTVDAVQITPIQSTTVVPGYTVTGRTVTFTGSGLNAIALAVTLYGN